jgi:hypothetical protein
MIQYIHARLGEWGRVVGRGGLIKGLGYPSGSAFTRLAPVGRMEPGVHDAAWEVERCVQDLDDSGRQLCILMYVQNQTWAQIESTMGCCRKTVSNRLHAVHVQIMEQIQDNALEVNFENISRAIKKSA